MVFRYKYQDGVWVDLEQPTEEEIREVMREFSIGERIGRELFSPTPSPLVTIDSTAALLVIHFPAQDAEKGGMENQEIDFIIGEHFIVTLHHQVIAPLYHLKKLLETRELVTGLSIQTENDIITTEVLFEIFFAHLYDSVRDYTNHIASRLSHVEQEMFSGNERKTVRLISDISREFLHLEAALANQEEPLGHFLDALKQSDFFTASFTERAKRILSERSHVSRLITTHRAVATEMRETNIALLEARQNEIMKTLTVVTFIFLPIELVTFVFGMGALGTPLTQNPNAFWIIVSIMLGVGGFMTLILTKKRWLF